MISEHSLWIDKMQDFAGALRQEAEAPEIARPQTVYLVDHDRLEREFLHRKADNELCGLGSDDERLKFETARRALRSFGVSDRETETFSGRHNNPAAEGKYLTNSLSPAFTTSATTRTLSRCLTVLLFFLTTRKKTWLQAAKSCFPAFRRNCGRL